MLRHDDRDPEIVDQSRDRREHLFRSGRIERRRRFVEDEHLRVRGQRRADRGALQLAAREGAQRASAEVGQPEQIERLLDAFAHDRGRDRELLHRVRELVLERVGDAARERILADDADHIGELARRVCTGVVARDGHTAAQLTAGEMRDQPVHGAEQGRLAGSGGADNETEFARRDLEVEVVQHRLVHARIRHRDLFEADHAGTTARRGWVRGTGAPVVDGGGGVAAAGSSATAIPITGSSASAGHAGARPTGRAPSGWCAASG